MSFAARFGFLLPVLVFPVPLSVFALLHFVAFCCFSLQVVALSGFSLLLMSITFHMSIAEANG